MKFLRYTLIATIALVLSSCGDPDLPFDLDESLNNTGGYVRILTIESAALDFANPNEASFRFIGEVGDTENGALSERVNFYARYVDFENNALPEVPLPGSGVEVSSLQINDDSGLPRGTFEVTLDQLLDAYGSDLELSDLSLGDRFDIRWELVMRDGRTFTNTDVNASITGGFYRSPFFARVNLVVSLPESVFIGEYTITQSRPSESISGAFFSGWLWNNQQTNVVTLTVDPENALVGRTFEARPYAEWGPNNAPIRTYPLDFGFFLTLATEVPVVGTCGGATMTFGPASGSRGSFNPNDDSEFTFVIREFPGWSSGNPCPEPDEIEFTAVKND